MRTDDGRVAHGADALVPSDNIQSRPNVHVFGLGRTQTTPEETSTGVARTTNGPGSTRNLSRRNSLLPLVHTWHHTGFKKQVVSQLHPFSFHFRGVTKSVAFTL